MMIILQDKNSKIKIKM